MKEHGGPSPLGQLGDRRCKVHGQLRHRPRGVGRNPIAVVDSSVERAPLEIVLDSLGVRIRRLRAPSERNRPRPAPDRRGTRRGQQELAAVQVLHEVSPQLANFAPHKVIESRSRFQPAMRVLSLASRWPGKRTVRLSVAFSKSASEDFSNER